MKIIIIGGGAGGMSAATRARRLSEKAEISIYEQGNYVAYSNCSLPYIFSHKVEKFDNLILKTPQNLKTDYNIDVFICHQVKSVDAISKTITVLNRKTNETSVVNYDKLVISAGVDPIMPPIPGLKEASNVFSLKTPDDVLLISNFLETKNVKKVSVIGAGFIGAEIGENFRKAGYEVDLIDMVDHIVPPLFDTDIAAHLHEALIKNGVNIYFNEQVSEIKDKGRKIILKSGKELQTDLIFMTVGVRVDKGIYSNANLAFGLTNGIIVNEKQETSIKDVYAIGDIAETFDIYGNKTRIALAAPALRQGTVAANSIFNYKDKDGEFDTYKGSQGTATISLFEVTGAGVGKTESQLKKENIKYYKTINSRGDYVGAIKGAKNILLKVLYDDSFKILGAQAIGPKGTEKRISYIALAMFANIPYSKLEDFQTAYSPTVDVPLDVVNIGSRIAKHQMSGEVKTIGPEGVSEMREKGAFFIDVREKSEWNDGHIEFATHIPLSEIRNSLSKFDLNKTYVINCQSGLRSYNASMAMQNLGFKNVINLAGGFMHYSVYKKYSKI